MIKIDKNKCEGCGACVNVCPQGYIMKNNKAEIRNHDADCLKDAIDICPTGAIIDTNYSNSTDKYASITGRGRGSGTGGKGRGSRRGSGRGRNRKMRDGTGRGGYCVCPVCGYRENHKLYTPCCERICPQCKEPLIKE